MQIKGQIKRRENRRANIFKDSRSEFLKVKRHKSSEYEHKRNLLKNIIQQTYRTPENKTNIQNKTTTKKLTCSQTPSQQTEENLQKLSLLKGSGKPNDSGGILFKVSKIIKNY